MKAPKGYKLGRASRVWKCCREIRIGACGSIEGDILSGVNTTTDQHEEWIVLKKEKDWNNSVVVQLIKL